MKHAYPGFVDSGQKDPIMRKIYKVLALTLLLSLLPGVSLTAQQAGQIKSMKLLTADVGWAATDKKLFWTTDNGAHWKNITPTLNHKHQTVSSVFFLDASKGWVLLSCGDDRDTLADEGCWALASTINAGGTWLVQQEKVPVPFSREYLRDSTGFSGRSWLQFIDPQHGWEVLEIATHSGIPRAGQMLRTVDGGETWVKTKELPFPDHFRFVTSGNGWVAGGDDGDLVATQDAGDTWQKVSLPDPDGLGQHLGGYYGLPVFETDRAGFTWVQYTTGPSEGPNEEVLILLSSDDRGKTWRERGRLSGLPDIYYAEVANQTLVAANSRLIKQSQGEGQCPEKRIALSLFSVGPDGATSHAVANLPRMDGSLERLSFSSRERGWAIILGRLFGTQNAGKNWAELTPGGAPHEPPSICVPVSWHEDSNFNYHGFLATPQ